MSNQTTAITKRVVSTASQVTVPSGVTVDVNRAQTILEQYQFISDAALKQGTHILAGVGAGKSRLLGRVFAWQQLVRGKSAIILDPTGGVTDNLFDKILRLPPEQQASLWPRILYCSPGAKQYIVPSALYYALDKSESLFESANRLPSVFKIQDPNLSSAPILGLNPLLECATHAGKIAKAKQLQLDFVADLLEHPGQYKGLLREVLAEYPALQPDVDYFRALMDPSSAGLREKKTGSFKTKLLPFIADPVRMATYAAKINLLDWTKLLAQRKLVVIDYREQRNADYLQFDMIWHLKTFINAIKYRGMAGRGHEVMLIIDEITAMLGQRTPDGRAILSEDLQELITRLGRNYGVNTVIAHQGLYQVDERIQDVLMGMGNQLIGQLSSPDDAVRVARQFMRYDPYRLKKTEKVWFATHEPPLVQFFNGTYGLPGAVPKVIDLHTHEFTPDEQLLDWVNKILDLDRFQFLTQISTAEGGQKGPVRKITTENLDRNQYPNEKILASLRQALAKRDGIPLEKLLAEIQANRLEVTPEKKQKSLRQPIKEPATMENTHDPRPTQPTPAISHTGAPSDKTTSAGDGASVRPTHEFWEPKTNDTADHPPNAS